jgi:hypothetical protein
MTCFKPKHVALLDTLLLLSKYTFVLTATNFVCYNIITQRDVTFNLLKPSGNFT